MKQQPPIYVDIAPGLSVLMSSLKLSFWTTKERPKKAKKGTLGFNSQTNSLELWDGAKWLSAQMS